MAAALAAPVVPAWAQGLGDFSAGPAPCRPDAKPTPATKEGPNFRAGAPARTSLLEPGVAGTKIILTGAVAGVSCGPIAKARLDFWQADAKGVYDASGFRLRGYQLTDAAGTYRLETIVPGPVAGRAPCLHVKVQPPGKPAFVTQLYFPDQPLNQKDPEFRSELVITMPKPGSAGPARFDITLDI
jgi:protocatechuate 3,4-dioxygenase beta subunit